LPISTQEKNRRSSFLKKWLNYVIRTMLFRAM